VPDAANFPFAGTYGSIDISTGRGTTTLPGAVFGQANPVTGVFFVNGQNLFVAIGTTPNVPSGLVFFNPQ
jgi:hypothetical protein